ncbi:IS30 family transposase [Salinisphaera sp.]|uniref:IS30 family transposase n=1 Tax=Salinisphaera sp. TaxID=1914330 RepID=UPI002D76995B|nr:IS30 family transposase [Salinisphaera sp.]HET7313843.1 IS30 family transposase [Salinisphaera sp.]
MKKTYTHLSVEERAVIQVRLEQGASVRAIARTLARSPATVSRELARNGWRNPARRPRRRGRPPLAGGYRATSAQKRARRLAATPRRPRKLTSDPWLWGRVVELLSTGHSPEQVSALLVRMHSEHARVSHETIYTALYALPRGALRRELIGLLRQRRTRRRPRSQGADRRGRIPNMTSIHLRPPEVDERVIPGHWEGDLIKGARNASAVGTLVERTSLFVSLVKVDNASAQAAVAGFSGVLNRIDAQRRLSLTYDQGKEMAQHEQLSRNTGMTVYFADPHSPWQRGINENTNGLLRQYLPKGADLSVFSQNELDDIAWRLNTRIRKSLGWKCPAELFIPDDFDMKAHYEKIVAPRP